MGWDDLNTFEGKQQVNSVKERSNAVCVCSCQTMREPGYEIETDCSVLSQRTKLRLKFELEKVNLSSTILSIFIVKILDKGTN